MEEERTFKKALITGISGSGGSYLGDYIVENHPSVNVSGISRWHSTSSNKNLEGIADKIELYECDLADMSSIIRTLDKANPDLIFHLASHANVRASWDNPLSVLQNNIMGTANLLEALRILNKKPLVQLCSTSEVYGQVSQKDIPIKETLNNEPVNIYAISKKTQDDLGNVYYKAFNIPIVRTRMFAYLNPRRSDLFATSFALQVARIEEGIQEVLLHGNLDSTRTIIDVRDAMESYWYAASKGKPGEAYNIGGTKIITVGEFLEVLKKNARCNIPSRVDPKLYRPVDVTLQIPDTSKFERDTGWKPKYSFDDSVKHLLDYCRKEVKAQKYLRNK